MTLIHLQDTEHRHVAVVLEQIQFIRDKVDGGKQSIGCFIKLVGENYKVEVIQTMGEVLEIIDKKQFYAVTKGVKLGAKL